jgi:hypothetical protein
MITYNGERRLDAQMDSILSQLAPQDELVASDDGSSDGTWALLAARAEQETGKDAVLVWGGEYWEQRDTKFPTPADYREVKQDACSFAQPAVVAAGGNRVGERLYICRDKKCKTHWTGSSSGGRCDSSPRRNGPSAEAKARKARDLEMKARAETLRRVLAAARKQKKVPIEDLRLVARQFVNLLPTQ